MKIKVKKLIRAKFNLYLEPSISYSATIRPDGHYSVKYNDIISIMVLKSNVEEISE